MQQPYVAWFAQKDCQASPVLSYHRAFRCYVGNPPNKMAMGPQFLHKGANWLRLGQVTCFLLDSNRMECNEESKLSYLLGNSETFQILLASQAVNGNSRHLSNTHAGRSISSLESTRATPRPRTHRGRPSNSICRKACQCLPVFSQSVAHVSLVIVERPQLPVPGTLRGFPRQHPPKAGSWAPVGSKTVRREVQLATRRTKTGKQGVPAARCTPFQAAQLYAVLKTATCSQLTNAMTEQFDNPPCTRGGFKQCESINQAR